MLHVKIDSYNSVYCYELSYIDHIIVQGMSPKNQHQRLRKGNPHPCFRPLCRVNARIYFITLIIIFDGPTCLYHLHFSLLSIPLLHVLAFTTAFFASLAAWSCANLFRFCSYSASRPALGTEVPIVSSITLILKRRTSSCN